MKILLWPECFWPHIGGIEVLTKELAFGLKNRGHEVTVLTTHLTNDLPDFEKLNGINIHRLHFHTSLNNKDLSMIKKTQKKLSELKVKLNPDIIHIHFGGPNTYFHLKTLNDIKSPTLLTIHSISENFDVGNGLFRQTLSNTENIDLASKTMIPKIQKIFPDKKFNPSVTYYGLRSPQTPIKPPDFKNPILLCLGRLIDWKGFDLALNAFKKIKDDYPSMKMLIAGDGPEKENLKKLCSKLELEKKVGFLGWIEPENVYNIINDSTIVLIPSRDHGGETLPTVSIQSSQMARPIIASNISGLPEIIKDKETGLLIEEDNVINLAESIKYFLDNPEKAISIGENARENALKNFSIESYLDSYENLYEMIIKK